MKPNLSRRQFLAHSAGLAGASLGIGMPRPARQGAAEVRVGIIGLGDRGRTLLGALGSLQRDDAGPRVRVVAISDASVQALRRARVALQDSDDSLEPPRLFPNYRELLDEKGVDAVIIATPVHLHAEQAITALAAGKHLYCEKPIGHDAEACRRVLEASRTAETAGRIVQFGFQRRYNPRYRRSIDLLRSGEAGQILYVRAQWHATGNPPREKPWIFQQEKSGGLVLEQACHQFDVFHWLLGGPPLRACGLGGVSRWRDDPPGRDIMDHFGATIEYPGGVHVQLSHVSFAIPDRRFSGIYELVFAERMGVDLGNAIAWTKEGPARQLLPPDATSRQGNDTESALRAFVASIANGQRPDANADVAYHATMAALLCQRALETGESVHFKEIDPA